MGDESTRVKCMSKKILEAVREYLEILSDWEDVDKKYVKELNNLLERL